MSEPRPDFKFRTGKYQGMTYEWVCNNNPNYVAWVKENQPNMLKDKVTTVTNVKEEKKVFGRLTPNMNFENEGPEECCIPYLEKMQREKDKKSPE